MEILIQHKAILVPLIGIVAAMLGGTVIFLSIRSLQSPEAF